MDSKKKKIIKKSVPKKPVIKKTITKKVVSKKQTIQKKIVKKNDAAAIEKCKKNFCEKESGKMLKNTLKYVLKKMEPIMQKKFIESMKKANPTISNSELEKQYKEVSVIIYTILEQQMKKTIEKECMKAFCNPGCKNTIYQNGKEFPKIDFTNALNTMKNMKLTEKEKSEFNKSMNSILKEAKKFREEIFKGKESVLKNGFYEKLKTANSLRKRGAISGCTLMNTTTNKHNKESLKQMNLYTNRFIKPMLNKMK